MHTIDCPPLAMSSDNSSQSANDKEGNEEPATYPITTRSVSKSNETATPSKRDAVLELTKNNNDFHSNNDSSSSNKKQRNTSRTLEYFSSQSMSQESVCSIITQGSPSTLPLSQNSETSSETMQEQGSDKTLHSVYSSSSKKSKRFSNFDKPHPETSENYSLVKKVGTNSNVWNYFHIFKSTSEGHCPPKVHANSDQCFAVCNDCGKIIKFSSNVKGNSSTTGGLNRHLFNIHKLTRNDVTNNIGSERPSDQLVDSNIHDAFNKSNGMRFLSSAHKREIFLRLTAEWVALDLQPLSVVESPSFRKLLHAHNPEARPMTNHLLKTTLKQLEIDMRQFMIAHIKKQNAWVTLTLDHWTSISKHNYTGKCRVSMFT